MELMTLDGFFQGNELVENYESLIWTERYSKAGDFQLTSTNITETLKALPLETYVSVRDSTVPMLVEVHKIEKKKNDVPRITVTGRSYEACALERRVTNNVLEADLIAHVAKTPWMEPAVKESDAAYKIIRKVIGDTARYQGVTLVLPLQDPYVSYDALSGIDLTLPADYQNITTFLAAISTWNSAITYNAGDKVVLSGVYYIAISPNLNKTPAANPLFWSVTPYSFEVKPQNLYQTVMELLAANNHGIKSVRPIGNPTATKAGVEIYNGANLTTEYVIDARLDQLDDATYLLSFAGSANVGYIYGTGGSELVFKNLNNNPADMQRRVLTVGDQADASLNTSAARNSRGLVELYNNNATALFGGEVADQVAADYNKVYFLGDIIKLQGDYDLYQDVRVAEFIRSSDAQGEKAYPTFEAVT